MAHKHTCLNCDAVIAEGDFDCELDRDHDFALCEKCAQLGDCGHPSHPIPCPYKH